jgi:hypothetical protein
LENRIKNITGQNTSSEEAPEYFGAKRRLSLKNENIMCDIWHCLPDHIVQDVDPAYGGGLS